MACVNFPQAYKDIVPNTCSLHRGRAGFNPPRNINSNINSGNQLANVMCNQREIGRGQMTGELGSSSVWKQMPTEQLIHSSQTSSSASLSLGFLICRDVRLLSPW